jgi:alpha-ketoglutarate-dependent taurine dioxygenase
MNLSVVKHAAVDEAKTLPLVVHPSGVRPDSVEQLREWWIANQKWIEPQIWTHGAILLRGFKISQPVFKKLMHASPGQQFDYQSGNSPRTNMGDGLYTSTEYPAKAPISLHNELSYAAKWPGRLFFCCVTRADQGGETTLADSRRILSELDSSIVAEFRHKQVKYIRNLHGGTGLGKSWQDTFETTDRRMLEEYARMNGMNVHWKADGSVRMTNVRPPITRHEVTGEEVWFNQAEQFHPTVHPPAIYKSLMSVYKDCVDDLPQNATFGDDTPIPEALLAEIRTTMSRHMVSVQWEEGDLLMVDNVLSCHGRMPYVGKRQILVYMTR